MLRCAQHDKIIPQHGKNFGQHGKNFGQHGKISAHDDKIIAYDDNIVLEGAKSAKRPPRFCHPEPQAKGLDASLRSA